VALQVSAWSLSGVTRACLPLFGYHASVVGLDFDASVAWPVYGWMGVAKAAFESTCRYLARELGPRGVRVNLVAAGPLRTMAMKSIPGSEQFEDAWAACAAGLGRQGHRTGGPRHRRPAVGLVPGDHRRDRARGRRLPRRRGLRAAGWRVGVAERPNGAEQRLCAEQFDHAENVCRIAVGCGRPSRIHQGVTAWLHSGR
jgi:NAD(P)-dependent dehydrogenase (short-subunit alcohol dehydrogenase family)